MTTAWKTTAFSAFPRPLEELPLPPRRCITTPPTVDTVVGRGRAGGRAGGGERSTLLPSLRPGRAAHNNGGAKAPHTSRAPGQPACQPARPTRPLPCPWPPRLPHRPWPPPPPPRRPTQVLQKLGASHATLPITSRGKRVPLAVPIFFRTAPDRLPTADPSARAQAPGRPAHPAGERPHSASRRRPQTTSAVVSRR